jgi:hypothetical protein
MITTRVIQGIRAGLLTLADRRMKPWILDYLPEEHLIDNHLELHKKLKWWALLSQGEKRMYLKRTQDDHIEPWSKILAGAGL